MADELPEFLKENHVDIAAAPTLPKANASEMADISWKTECRRSGILHTQTCICRSMWSVNVHLSESLMQLSYNLNTSNGSIRSRHVEHIEPKKQRVSQRWQRYTLFLRVKSMKTSEGDEKHGVSAEF